MRSYRFSHAICRLPAESCVDGLRAVDVGAPDFKAFMGHHDAYVAALRATGAEVAVLEALDAFPDSVFVEDASLCLPEIALVLRPGAPSRLGEAEAMRPTLEALYSTVLTVETGYLDGGDILVTEREILVGQSARTDSAGIAALRQLTAPYGYTVREVQTPPGVLHFKTDCALLDEDTILSTARLAATGCFEGYRIIETAEGEDAAANCIRFNDALIIPGGFPETAERLSAYNLVPLPNTEAAKLDAGMSCMSLRFSPS